MDMKVGGNNTVKQVGGGRAIDDCPPGQSSANLFAQEMARDTMGGLRANLPNRTGAVGGGRSGGIPRYNMEELLAQMGAKDSKKQAFDVASDAFSNVVKGGFKEAGSALGAISGIGDSLGGVMNALGSIGGMLKNLMPIIGAVMSFF